MKKIFLTGIVLFLVLTVDAQTYESINRETILAKTGSLGVNPDFTKWYIDKEGVTSVNSKGDAGNIYEVILADTEVGFYKLKSKDGSIYSLMVRHHKSNLYFVTFVPFGENPEWKSVYLCMLSKK